jgi:hypothetical protein
VPSVAAENFPAEITGPSAWYGPDLATRGDWIEALSEGDLAEIEQATNHVIRRLTALARFDQVEGVTDEERRQAFSNIKKAARHYDVEMNAKSWREFAHAT